MADAKTGLTLEDLKLPIPEVEEPEVTISYDGESYRATWSNGDYINGEDLVSNYDTVVEKTRNLRFDSSLPEYDPEMKEVIFMPVDEQGTGRILVASSDESRREYLEDSVKNFLSVLNDYIENPNFYNSYRFIDFHPIFWRKAEPEDTLPTWDWVTDSGCTQVEIFVYEETPGEIVVSLEAGPTWIADETASEIDLYVKQSYYTTSHDYRLDAYASTYEEAIIKLAKNIYNYYNIDGTERELEYDNE